MVFDTIQPLHEMLGELNRYDVGLSVQVKVLDDGKPGAGYVATNIDPSVKYLSQKSHGVFLGFLDPVNG